MKITECTIAQFSNIFSLSEYDAGLIFKTMRILHSHGYSELQRISRDDVLYFIDRHWCYL
jgi:hypothetical protein